MEIRILVMVAAEEEAGEKFSFVCVPDCRHDAVTVESYLRNYDRTTTNAISRFR